MKYNLLNVIYILVYLFEVRTFMYKEFNDKFPDTSISTSKKACTGTKHVLLKLAEEYEIPNFKRKFCPESN